MSKVIEAAKTVQAAALNLENTKDQLASAMKELAEMRLRFAAVLDFAEACHEQHGRALRRFQEAREKAKEIWETRDE